MWQFEVPAAPTRMKNTNIKVKLRTGSLKVFFLSVFGSYFRLGDRSVSVLSKNRNTTSQTALNECLSSWSAGPVCLTCGSLALHQPLHQLQRQREHDGGVLLGGDGVEGLQVTQLQGRRGLSDDQRGLLQGPRCVHLPLRCDHLEEETGRTRELILHLRGVRLDNLFPTLST